MQRTSGYLEGYSWLLAQYQPFHAH
jgi:hypothetical protein